MYSKLAFRNIKRSLKDYTMYFLTLVFGVCVFYTFNAIESQSVMMELSDMQKNAFQLVDSVMGGISVFVALTLGFLIIYANNYLIKRRKKEFGIYMTLGMEKGSLSKIVFIETLLIGIVSLIFGLIIGIFLSQGISVVTAKLFKADLTKFKFAFSSSAFLRTVICFAIIYCVVLIFNFIIIRKVRLINLLTSSKKNESIKVKNIWVSVIIFILSILCIGYAYYDVLNKGLSTIGFNVNGLCLLSGSVGTFLFFFSLSGFLLKLAQSNRKYYLRDLNMFVLRQINSKINTNFISMSFICLMLFISICTFSGGMGINKGLNDDLKDLTQFDISFWDYNGKEIEEVLKLNGLDLSNQKVKYAGYIEYDSEFSYNEFLSKKAREKGKSYFPIAKNQNIFAIKLSDFNRTMELLGREKINLHKNQYAVLSDIDDVIPLLEGSLDNKKNIMISGTILNPYKNKVIKATTYNQMMKSNLCTFIVDDSLIGSLVAKSSILNINCEGNKESIEELVGKSIRGKYSDSNFKTHYLTKEELIDNSVGIGAVAAYLGIYIGIIFLLTSSAVLALQQLSESTENIERYDLLRKIGVDNLIINKSLFRQIAIYFMMPLSLAIVHSVVGLIVVSKIVSLLGSSGIMINVVVTAIFIVIIYGGYFVATYLGAKKNIS